jgi:hypothetical protein
MDPTKLVLHFIESFVIFYTIYKNQHFGFTFGVTFLHFGPWKGFGLCNLVPKAAGRRGSPKSGEAGGALGRGMGGGRPRGHLGPICVWLRGGEAGGKGVRRRTGVTAAGAVAPASLPAKGERRRCG